MDSNKFNNIDINTIMKIAQTGNAPVKVGGHGRKKEKYHDVVSDWMKEIDLREGPIKVLSSDLFYCFEIWNKKNNNPEIHIKKFGRVMSKLLRKVRGNKGQLYFCNKNPKESVTNDKEKEV